MLRFGKLFSMKKFKTKLNREQLKALHYILSYYIENARPVDYHEALVIAVLSEIVKAIGARLADIYQRDFAMNWNGIQSTAMILFFKAYFNLEPQPEREYYDLIFSRIYGQLLQQYLLP